MRETLIYSPATLSRNAERQLEKALEQDGARVHYVGNDGEEEFVIVEASGFERTRAVAAQLGLCLAWQPSRPGLETETTPGNHQRRPPTT